MRAVGDAAGAVLRFTGDIHVSVACTRSEHHASSLEGDSALQIDLDELSTTQSLGPLVLHNVHRVGGDMSLECSGKSRTIGFQHGNVVFNSERVLHLATKSIHDDAC